MTEKIEALEAILAGAMDIDNLPLEEAAADLLKALKTEQLEQEEQK